MKWHLEKRLKSQFAHFQNISDTDLLQELLLESYLLTLYPLWYIP